MLEDRSRPTKLKESRLLILSSTTIMIITIIILSILLFFNKITSFDFLIGLTLTVPLFISYIRRNNDGTSDEITSIQNERQEINERLKENKSEDVIDTIRLGLNQLTEYYVINKSQAKSSFNFSLFAIIAGLATIITGIVLFYLQKAQSIPLTALTGVSGALLEFIGGAYFFVYRKSIEQMNIYFDQLVKMQDTMLAVKLTQEIKNDERQGLLTEELVLGLLERSSKAKTDLTNSISKQDGIVRGYRSKPSVPKDGTSEPDPAK